MLGLLVDFLAVPAAGLLTYVSACSWMELRADGAWLAKVEKRNLRCSAILTTACAAGLILSLLF